MKPPPSLMDHLDRSVFNAIRRPAFAPHAYLEDPAAERLAYDLRPLVADSGAQHGAADMARSAARMIADTRIFWRLPHSDHSDAERSGHYDAFRDRLLPGRAELFTSLELPPGSRLVELGAGAGRNLGWLEARQVAGLGRADLVDLSEPLLTQARQRWQGLPQLVCHRADAAAWRPERPADVVVLAYSLTMMRDWRAVVDNALSMLRPGGRLAVVDFTLTPEQPALARSYWKSWFAHDGVHLDAAHLPTLKSLLPDHGAELRATHLPCLPGLTVPYYRFVGSKPPA